MSRYLSIFLASDKNMSDLAVELGRKLGMKFNKVEDAEEIYYIHHGSKFQLILDSHDLENDQGIPFEDFPFSVEIEVFGIREGNERTKKQNEIGNWIFETLLSEKKYRLMMVSDVQTIMRQFDLNPPN